jgi:hypothetical protein
MSEDLELLMAERAIGSFADTYARGIRSADDIVYYILDE